MRTLALLFVALLVAIMAGCGGSGSNSGTKPGTGTAAGRLTAPNASAYTLTVDGQTLRQRPDATGHFSIPNLPAGSHSLAIVGGGGFSGAHVGFTITSGGTVNLGDVTAQPGGQIAGIVAKKDDAGNLSVLEGVEVLADAQPIYYIDGQATSAANTARQADSIQLRAITDANGSYVIPAVPAGSYAVTVNVPGLEQGSDWVYVSPASTSPADFQLLAAIDPGIGTVMGTILGVGSDSTSAPLEGATVTITPENSWQPVPLAHPLPLPVEAMTKALVPKQATAFMPPTYIYDQFTTLTDANGQYTLNVPSGHLSISVWADGYDGAWGAFSLQPEQTLTQDYTLQASTVVVPVDPPATQPDAKRKH